jgi:hypothetical protein
MDACSDLFLFGKRCTENTVSVITGPEDDSSETLETCGGEINLVSYAVCRNVNYAFQSSLPPWILRRISFPFLAMASVCRGKVGLDQLGARA